MNKRSITSGGTKFTNYTGEEEKGKEIKQSQAGDAQKQKKARTLQKTSRKSESSSSSNYQKTDNGNCIVLDSTNTRGAILPRRNNTMKRCGLCSSGCTSCCTHCKCLKCCHCHLVRVVSPRDETHLMLCLIRREIPLELAHQVCSFLYKRPPNAHRRCWNGCRCPWWVDDHATACFFGEPDLDALGRCISCGKPLDNHNQMGDY